MSSCLRPSLHGTTLIAQEWMSSGNYLVWAIRSNQDIVREEIALHHQLIKSIMVLALSRQKVGQCPVFWWGVFRPLPIMMTLASKVSKWPFDVRRLMVRHIVKMTKKALTSNTPQGRKTFRGADLRQRLEAVPRWPGDRFLAAKSVTTPMEAFIFLSKNINAISTSVNLISDNAQWLQLKTHSIFCHSDSILFSLDCDGKRCMCDLRFSGFLFFGVWSFISNGAMCR